MSPIRRLITNLDLLGDPEILQIDFVPVGPDVLAYLHLADEELNGGLPVIALFEKAALAEQSETAVRAAIKFQRLLDADPVRA